jgi:hypothetical protein
VFLSVSAGRSRRTRIDRVPRLCVHRPIRGQVRKFSRIQARTPEVAGEGAQVRATDGDPRAVIATLGIVASTGSLGRVS